LKTKLVNENQHQKFKVESLTRGLWSNERFGRSLINNPRLNVFIYLYSRVMLLVWQSSGSI